MLIQQDQLLFCANQPYFANRQAFIIFAQSHLKMNVLLKKVTILCSSSAHHLQVKDILIKDGIISKIGDGLSDDTAQVITGNDLHVSIGWTDIFADFGEPGHEYRETLETGAKAAAAGGFTDIFLVPNTDPAISSKAQAEFLKQRSKDLAVNIHPIGAVTKNTEGKELAEMYDMYESGAVAFGDGKKSVQHAGMMLKALQYVQARNAVLIQLPDDESLSGGGLMNEGIMSTRLGLAGKPAIAEELMIERDLALLKYTGSKLHITAVSTAKGIELIAKAKKEGLDVTCSVTPYHLYFCDEDLEQYDSNLKLNPPLRTRADMEALRNALNAGLIDCTASHHFPQRSDDKNCEFEYAKDGMAAVQNVYGVLNSFTDNKEMLTEMMSTTPRKIFGLELPGISEGAEACLTIFEPRANFVFEENMIFSKSKNNPFPGKEMKGKVTGIINKHQTVING